MKEQTQTAPPRVVVIGAGFGGLAVAKSLGGYPVEITVIDRTNHHLFQPLLYQVATAGLSPGHIAQPIRGILRNEKNATVILDDVERISVAEKKVFSKEREYAYDYLVVATGARHSYFGNDQWEKFAPGLKNLDDALELRRRILMAFEVAEKAEDPKEKAAALTFVVIGAGPTGVEMAGAILETARYTLRKDFRHIDPTEARVILIDAAPRVLPTFHEELSQKAENKLREMQIDVRCGAKVKNLSEGIVELEDETIHARTIVWAAGNAASPLGRMLGTEVDRAGRVVVNEDLTVPGYPEVYVIGDLANFSHQGGQPLPGVSPVAMQQGRHVAGNILGAMAGKKGKPFRYFDKGSMATIGRNAAVADVHFLRFDGFLAWLAWLFVHLLFLVGLRNRISVFFHWLWAYFTFAKGARLINGRQRRPSQAEG